MKSIIVLLSILTTCDVLALGYDEKQCHDDVVGQFAYYKLAISRSREWCIANKKERYPECSREYTVHGLWPQCERGFPQYCRVTNSGLSDYVDYKKVSKITPSRCLIKHEWKKHGVCTGLKRSRYFTKAMEFWNKLTLPSMKPGWYDYQKIIHAWIKTNPELTADSIELACDEERRKPRSDGRTLDEIRICFSKDGYFMPCSERENSCSKLKSIRIRG